MVNDGKIEMSAPEPQVRHRHSPLSLQDLRRYCQETDGMSYGQLIKAIMVNLKTVKGVKWVWRVTPTTLFVVWAEPHITTELWKRELKLKNALIGTINLYELAHRSRVN